MLGSESLHQPTDVSPEAIQAEVERILASQSFARSARLRSFLKFTVAETLQGNAHVLKEYVIGTEVLHKPESYDPRSDSLVRVLASRLRVKLKHYYANGGSEDGLVIHFPKGGYVPVFQRREQIRAELENKLNARNLYSCAKFKASQLTADALDESMKSLKESIAADPEWPAAHVALAGVHAFQGFLGVSRPRDAWPAAITAAKAALQRDDMSSEANMYLGLARAFYEWRWKDAEASLARAIERDPYSGEPYMWRALACFVPTGRLADAQQDIHRACELAPSAFIGKAHALALYLLGQYDAVLKKTENHEPDDRSGNWLPWLRSLSLAATGRPQAAVKLLEQLSGATASDTRIASALGCLYAQVGHEDKARAILDALTSRKPEHAGWTPNYDVAVIHAGLGNRNEAIACLQESFKEREPWALYLNADPRLTPLKSTGQFASLATRLVSPDPQAASA